MKFRSLIALALSLWLLAACVATGVEPDQLIMPHDLHYEMEVECETCHEGVSESTSALDLHRPDMDVCEDCHDVEDENECGMCHTNVDEAMSLTPPPWPAEKFSHAAHLEQGMTCARCHGDLSVVAPRIPVKTDCRVCHETVAAYADCALCHRAGERMIPVTHRGNWIQEHGARARVDREDCGKCHTESQCLECHAGDNVRPRSHGLNFVLEHAIKARSNETECFSCHQDPGFCGACHMAERILPRSHSRVGWVRLPDGGRHAVDGLFEIESCIACHDAGGGSPTCAPCHGG